MKRPVGSRPLGPAVVAVAGLAGLLYLFRYLPESVSVTSRGLVLLAAFLLLLLVELRTGWHLPLVVMASYLVFVGYVLSAFGLGYLALGVGALAGLYVLLPLAYALHDRRMQPSPRTAKLVAVALFIFLAAVVAVDLQAGDVTHELELRDQVTLPETLVGEDEESQEVTVGTATSSNTFFFHERANFPTVRVCVYTPERLRGHSPTFVGSAGGMSITGYSVVPPAGSVSADVTVGLSADEVAAIDGPLPVERAATCPEESDEEKIVVTVG